MNQETKNPIDHQLLLIEKPRQQLVSEVLKKTDLLLGDFAIEISISFADDASNEFYEAAKRLGWQHDNKDGAVWYTSEIPGDGETVIFGVSNRGKADEGPRND